MVEYVFSRTAKIRCYKCGKTSTVGEKVLASHMECKACGEQVTLAMLRQKVGLRYCVQVRNKATRKSVAFKQFNHRQAREDFIAAIRLGSIEIEPKELTPDQTPLSTVLNSWLKEVFNSSSEEHREAVHRIVRILNSGKYGWPVDIPVSKFTTAHVQQFVTAMQQQNKARSTIQNYFKPPRQALDWFINKHNLDMKNPLAGVKISKHKAVKIREFWNNELHGLFLETLAADVATSAFSRRRLRLAVEILYKTGMRASEFINVREDDLVREGKHWFLKLAGDITKTKTARMVYVEPETLALIKELASIQKNDPADGWLYKRSRQSLTKAFKRIVLRMPIPKNLQDVLCVHSLRHGYATNLVSVGMPLNTVQVLTGHADVRSLARYVHATQHVKAAQKLLELAELK